MKKATKKQTPCNICKAFSVTPARNAAGRFKTKAKPKAGRKVKPSKQRGLF
jgi:hypothetical protein